MPRRTVLQTWLGMSAALVAHSSVSADTAPAAEDDATRNPSSGEKLNVAVVQLRSTSDLDRNLELHCDYIRRCAKDGARVIVFPECSVTSYTKDALSEGVVDRLGEAEARIAAAAKAANAYAIVGMPTRASGAVYNSGVVATPAGTILERYHKIQLVGEKWATSGDHMSVFPIDGVLCSIIVCHDERYPELVRLPVLAGSRVVFYISHESGIEKERKIGPYRAQIQARAAENGVFVVHANAPAEKKWPGGSHGESRVILPDGNIVVEASIFEEEVVTATLDLQLATGKLAKRSLEYEALRAWWEEGIAKVRRIAP